jgi:ArsR family transcriptional regulator, arsenate/arsenite/antimonite-responsive transcriptional repressor
MDYSYIQYVSLFKALSDQTRLKIVELLSGGEKCACQLLDNFNITQPTLSYHMKILCDSGLVRGRPEGQWMYYSNNDEVLENISTYFSEIKYRQHHQ